jgi:hypothetical protein
VRVVVLKSTKGKIVFRFHARDLQFVLGPTAHGKLVYFHVAIDGHPSGDNHAVDTVALNNGAPFFR